MIVLDAYAVLAYLRREPSAALVRDLLRETTALSTVNAVEVVDQLVRVDQVGAHDVHADLVELSIAGMRLVPVSFDIGMSAGRLRAKHYHRTRMPVSLADCVAVATAMSIGRSLATADPGIAAMLRLEGGEIEPLPDSSGRMP